MSVLTISELRRKVLSYIIDVRIALTTLKRDVSDNKDIGLSLPYFENLVSDLGVSSRELQSLLFPSKPI